MRSLSRGLPAFAVGLLFLAASASALPTTYSMVAGSQMSMVNQACTPCTVPVTGSVTLDDDGQGNVALTQMSLAHAAYEVALPAFISIVLERTSIALAAGSVAGTGSTQTSVLFGPTSIAHVGTGTCTSAVLHCVDFLGLPDGTYPLPSPITVDLGTWTFDALGGLSATFVYTFRSAANATETMTVVGSSAAVPEPGTGLLVLAGLTSLAARRPGHSSPPSTSPRVARSRSSAGSC